MPAEVMEQRGNPQQMSEPETATEASRCVSVAGAIKTIGLCSVYIVLSCLLILFNKHLLHKDRFPFAIALTSCHMSMTCLLCYAIYFIKPSLYPAMANLQGQRGKIFKYFIPLGFLFAISLVCSNQAYFYCSVSFLQFVKEGNVVIVFFLGCLCGLQRCTRSKFFVLAWVVIGSCMAVHGEMNFVMLGLIIQLCSQLCECSRTVLGQLIMTGELKLDPLTYTMFVAPVSLSFLVVASALTWDHEIYVRLTEFWHLILPNSCLAFMLNCCIAILIKECSAMTFMFAGLLKDMVLVTASVFWFRDTVSLAQVVGFTITLGGIGFWSYMHIEPTSPLVKIFKVSLGELEQAEKSEQQPLLGKKDMIV